MASLKDYTTICNSAPSEFLAEVGMRNRKKLAQRNLDIIKHNLTVIDNLFKRHADLFSWIRPKAGSMGFPRLLRGDVEAFCDEDRKSTRLNSSHLVISYAVFCL